MDKFYLGGGPTPTVVNSEIVATIDNGPVCVTLSNGTMVMTYQGADAPHIKFSSDYGENWTAEDTDLSGEAITKPAFVGEPYLTLAPNGDLLLLQGRAYNSDQGTWLSRSTDGGLTWADSEQLSVTGIENISFANLIDDSFVYDGVLYLSGRISTDASETGVKSILIKTDDSGVTWTYISDMCGAGLANENGIVYLGDGKIFAILRPASVNIGAYYTISNDMGATWSALLRLPSWFGKPRIFTSAELRGEANWWTDTKLICCGFYWIGSSRVVSLLLSSDGGASWTLPNAIDDHCPGNTMIGYGDLAYNPDSAQYVALNTWWNEDNVRELKKYNFTVDWDA